MTAPPDLGRLAAAAAHDPGALEELLAAVRPEVLRVCARFLPNREDAEEACQDTLLAVAQGIANFEGRSAFRTWLYRIAANRSRTTYQVLRRRFLAEASGPLPERPDPQRTSVVAGTRLDLLDALERLGPQLAEPVALRDVIGLSYAEIATSLDLAEGTVKSRIHEARRRLRGHLDDEKSDLQHRSNK
ncbi:RNA polymerase sigma factor [Actinoplanes sp. NPDC051475]|uniref:RNA polymerase sigma factor n=1 Tax=Actinoplanes sp. NPDC051475 TaxID=3157225 RepID=UPI00344E55A6